MALFFLQQYGEESGLSVFRCVANLRAVGEEENVVMLLCPLFQLVELGPHVHPASLWASRASSSSRRSRISSCSFTFNSVAMARRRTLYICETTAPTPLSTVPSNTLAASSESCVLMSGFAPSPRTVCF